MNEAKHTPGPWRISDENPKIIKEDLSMIGSNRGVLIASACGHHSSGLYPSEEQAIVNAHLIAAAPELLGALRGLLALEEENLRGYDDIDVCAEVQFARFAIAKATGRADSSDGSQKDNT